MDRKNIKNASNQSKALVLAFPVIGNFLAWKVGNGTRGRLGTDAIMNVTTRYSLLLIWSIIFRI